MAPSHPDDTTLLPPGHGGPESEGTGEPTLPDSASAPPSSEEQLDRFQLHRLIGEGGMGRVWEARDPRLDRWVAIKRLHVADPTARRRFLREARLQAAIAHPGICPVFEVGQAEGVPYIVMPRLRGLPLDRATEDEALEQKLVLLRGVAEAVHAAHRQGLIHRDLKPSNILVERPEDGPPRPVVLDFGIARPLAGDELTASGQVMGTPSYMAPEQVRGDVEQLDRRTDVYALGATLYRLLAGRPPHVGKGGRLMERILRDEPPRLRPAGIPADVEAVVFKCLEKEKERRYDSALALAEDLRRYLEGEPVRARRIGRRVRLVKWLRRHRAAVRVAAVAAPLLAVALAWGAWSSWKSEERERLARRFGAQVEEVEALVRYSHLVPLHDVRPDRVELRRLLDSIRDGLAEADPAARALAHHALGRGHLALDELETARRHLQSALDLDPDNPEVAADLGRALSELYRDRLTSLERIGDRAGRESLREQLRRKLDATFGRPVEQQKQLQRSLGRPARDLLVRGRSPRPREELMLETLRLFHDGRPAEALGRLSEAPPGPSWEYERLRLEGDIRRSWAVSLHTEGIGAEAQGIEAQDPEAGDREARRQLELARDAYARARKVAESDPALLRDDAQAVSLLVRLGLAEPDEIEPLIEEGLGRLADARVAHPDSIRNWLWTARLQLAAAAHAIDRALDPTARLDAALAAGRRALELDDGSSEVWYELARAHWQKARWVRDQGGDPDPSFARAAEAFARVATEDRGYAYFTSLGLLRMAVAKRRAELGLDAAATYRSAIEAYRAAADLHSTPFAALSNLGISLLHASAMKGADPRDLLGRAVEALEKARELNPDHMVPHYYLGYCRLRLAQGGDSASVTLDGSLAERAADHFERAAELAPDQFQAQVGLGEVFHLRALDAQIRGADPGIFFARAREAHERALALAPDQPTVVLNLAWTVYFEGKFALRDGLDAGALLAEAEKLCERSLAARRRANALLCLGSVRRLQAESLVEEGRPAEAGVLVEEARLLLEEILALDGNHAEAHRSLGRLFTLEARRLRGLGQDSEPALELADRFLDRALELEDRVIFFWLADARRHLERAEGLVAAGRDGTEAVAAARRSLERAAQQAPDSPEIERLLARLASLAH